MPLYTCIADSRTSDEDRKRIAVAITESHCRHTGAPAEFVHVFFNDYLGRTPKWALRIAGNVRSGRPPELVSRLHDDICNRVAEILSSVPSRVSLVLQEVPAEWAMEGGAVLPRPGTEEDWMRKHWSEHEEEPAREGMTASPGD